MNTDIEQHINEAQSYRRRARGKLAADDENGARDDFNLALNEIANGLQVADEEEPPDADDPTADDLDLAAQLADLWGIKGGTYRDMESLDDHAIEEAIKAYDRGAGYERDFKLPSTYNFVNQLVLRIMHDSSLLSDEDREISLPNARKEEVPDTMLGWLSVADRQIEDTLTLREDRAWAYADRVLLTALQPGVDWSVRLSEFENQVTKDGDSYPYESLLAVLRGLIKEGLHPGTEAALVSIGETLRSKLPEDKRGPKLAQ